MRKLAGYRLDTNQLLSLSKAIERVRSEGVSLAPLRPYRLGLISNSTSDFVTGALTATAARHGIDLECIAAGYDQAVQESLDAHSAVNSSAPDGVLIAIDWRGLPILPSPGDSERGVETLRASIAHLRLMATGIRQNTKATCIFQTLAAPPEALFGSLDRLLPGTTRWLIDEINRAIRDLASETEGIVVDIAGAAETVGLANWHSPEQWNIAKLAFSQDYAPLYAEYVCRAISAVRGATRRCLVLDLDNTLWGGVIGDDGVNGIRVAQGDADGEAYLALQSYILALRNRGVVLAVSSKNEDETARSPFREHPDMVLREEHFAIFQANWNDKPTNIRAIAQELSLGLDSFVFVDDNPFERELVRQSLPEVAVPEMPEDPARYARTLAAAGYFESVVFSEEDRKRASYYEGNARRAALQKQVTDLEAYLASLKMEITFQPFNEVGRARIAQLINKSNQFNLTTKRYTESDVARMEADPSYFTLQVRLTDVYGDNGMISVIICRKDSTAEWEIDLWLMSCRVLGRRVENMALRELVGHARRAGVQTLTGAYIPTARNKLVERHYASLGFNQVRGAKDGATLWELDTHVDLPTFPMTVRSLGFPETAMPAGRFF
ncbi:MAG TPA: HAD-IIIC family phosphatase [Bryobacteraceae bacterium]|nr:HAD-IIIC family phosphatase [Bryobacteraceae bacterium]